MRLSGLRGERARASTQWRGGTFRNTFDVAATLAGPKLPVLREFLFGGGKRKPPVALKPLIEAYRTKAIDGLDESWKAIIQGAIDDNK